MSRIHASCSERCGMGGRTDAGTFGRTGAGGLLSRRKLFRKLWPTLKRFHCASSPPSPSGGGLSFLICTEGEEKESSLNKNSRGRFYGWAPSQPQQGGASERDFVYGEIKPLVAFSAAPACSGLVAGSGAPAWPDEAEGHLGTKILGAPAPVQVLTSS